MLSLCLPSACLEKAVTLCWPQEEKLELGARVEQTDTVERALAPKRHELEACLDQFLLQLLRGLNVKFLGHMTSSEYHSLSSCLPPCLLQPPFRAIVKHPRMGPLLWNTYADETCGIVCIEKVTKHRLAAPRASTLPWSQTEPSFIPASATYELCALEQLT